MARGKQARLTDVKVIVCDYPDGRLEITHEATSLPYNTAGASSWTACRGKLDGCNGNSRADGEALASRGERPRPRPDRPATRQEASATIVTGVGRRIDKPVLSKRCRLSLFTEKVTCIPGVGAVAAGTKAPISVPAA